MQEVLTTLYAESPYKYAEYKKTGVMPEQPKKEASAASKVQPPEKKVESATDKVGTAPDPDAGKESQESKKGKLTAAERIGQLIAKNKELEEKLKAVRPAVQDEAKPEVKADADKKPKTPPKPEPTDKKYLDSKAADPFAEYLEDLADWKAEQKFETKFAAKKAEEEKAEEGRKVAEANKAIETEWNKRVDAASKKHPDLKEVLSAVVQAKLIPQNGPIDAYILDSPMGVEVFYELCSNPDEIARISALSPVQQIRELDKIERGLATAEDDKKDDIPLDKEENTAPVIKTTSAKRPPFEAGGRSTTPDDPAEAALKRRDFAAYQKAENAKELARRSKG
jgi:hypothetical protein